MKKLFHYIILGLLILMIGFLVITLFKPDLLLPIIDWIKGQIESLGKWNYLLAFVSALVESLPIIGTIIPGQVVMLSVGGFYGGTGVTQFTGVLIFAILGSVISNAIGYFLGKYYGEDFFKTYGVWVGIEQTELKYLKKGVNTWGAWGIILSKFHPHFRAFLPFIAGSMGFKQTRFWIYNILASTLWASVFITIGIFFAEYYETILRYIGWVFTGILVGVLTYYWYFKRDAMLKYWREKNLEMEAKYNK
ncbi:DedA family protein [Candidatus Gracilibacteria bacterium]|nr:DedA family protein [Candidatus Gracilibacteria bacterium]